MGEPAGIGTELLLRAYRHFADMPPGKGPYFYLIDDPVRVARVVHQRGAQIRVETISAPQDAAGAFHHGLPVLPRCGDCAALAMVTPGRPVPETAAVVIRSIDVAVEAAIRGEASGVVTLPIQKETLQRAGFKFSGHTDYIAALTASAPMPDETLRGPVMMLTAGPFRVVPLTVHIPVSAVPSALQAEHIIRTVRIVHASLQRDYGLPAPRIAMAGLNPHAGEGGHMGREEIEIMAPALDALRRDGLSVLGPLPADTMFHEEARAGYDCAIAMYHDQALIPIKTIAFFAAINTTLGLPIVRTSPDHGTGLGLVGRDLARADSLINAIYAAYRIAGARAAHALA